jgi:superfamily II DNA helicase RecQ
MHTPVLALTATANKEMHNRLAKYLGMKRIEHIVISPNKNNLRFTVLRADKQLHCFDWLMHLMLERKGETPFTIIFCRTVNDIVSLLTHLQEARRGGRDGKQAFHLTIYHGRHLTACE